MKVVQTSGFLDPDGRDPETLLDCWKPLSDGASALAGEGLDVTVVLAADRAARIERDGVVYDFRAVGRSIWNLKVGAMVDAVVRARPDVVHVHGFNAPVYVARLTRRLGDVPVLVQDHAARPARGWRRRLARWSFRQVAAVAFTARPQAAPFVSAGIVSSRTPVFEVVEASSRFCPGDRDHARRQSGVAGDPALLWVGRLDPNKDPMTVLDGVESALDHLPRLEAWFLFQTAPLLDQVRRRIGESPRLSRAVHLVGEVTPDRVEEFCRASDLYVTASHREGSGFALIEAIACGLPPVVSAIPSFMRITGNGRVGAVFPPGDGDQLGAAVLRCWREQRAGTRPSVRRHFEESLSWAVLGREWERVYRRLGSGS